MGQIPLLVLGTGATVIASQTVISGTYSISRQAIQLGLIPRMPIRHMSEEVFDMMRTLFFLEWEMIVPSAKPDLNPLQERLFIVMASNASAAPDFFCVPLNRVVELGAQIEV